MTRKFLIRPAIPQDWEQIVEIYNYYILHTSFNFEYDPYTVQTRLPWFERFQNQSLYQLLVAINENNQVTAYAATTPFGLTVGYHTSANVGIYCHPQYTKAGLGSKLLEEIIEQCKRVNIHNLYAAITMANNASIQLFKKYHFMQVAHYNKVGYKFNQFWDVVWYEKRLFQG